MTGVMEYALPDIEAGRVHFAETRGWPAVVLVVGFTTAT
jgi:hypothetical protein